MWTLVSLAVAAALCCGDEIRIRIIKLPVKFMLGLMFRDMRVKVLAWCRFISCGVLCGVIRLPMFVEARVISK